MATVFQGRDSFQGMGGAVQVHWWTTTGNNISIASVVNRNVQGQNQGNTVSAWPASIRTAVNSAFFPLNASNNSLANAFAINNGRIVLESHPDGLDGSTNWEDHPGGLSMDFMMDPVNRSGNLVVFGNSGTFPITNASNGRSFNMADIQWGIGGMSLEMANTAFNNSGTFNSQFRYRNTGGGNTGARANRVAIGYLGGSVAQTNYIVAIFENCFVFDVRSWLQSRGVSTFGLLLDGGGSAQARQNASTIVSSTRRIPVVLSM